MKDVEATPAFAFRCLQAFEDVEEGEWRGGVRDGFLSECGED
jgi:hypothetical protein